MTNAEQWLHFFGRFHPLVVHLPIGFFCMVFLLELPFIKKRIPYTIDIAIAFILAWGFAGAVVSCLIGWLLSLSGNYDEQTLQLHQWMGIVLAVVAGLCWWLKRRNGQKRVYHVSLTLLFITLMLTGHWGGSMTHGDGYLLFSENEKELDFERRPISDINEAVVYTDLVQPILHEKCYNCHGAKKVKGGLRVDNQKLLFKGGKSGLSIHAGNPGESVLMKRLLLPMDDEKRMPPKKQPQLTNAETAIIQWWIANDASIDKRVKELSAVDAMRDALAAFGTPAGDKEEITPLSPVYDKKLPAADPEVIGVLRKLGVLVEPVTQGSTLLDISCVNYPAFDDSQMELLIKIAANIVSLKLDNTAITDNTIEKIGGFENLVKLHLAYTTISGTSLSALQFLSALEYINLTGTQVDDKALSTLSLIPSIKQLYCWNTRVTGRGIADLKDKHPDLLVEAGYR